MNQQELNRIAWEEIRRQSVELFAYLHLQLGTKSREKRMKMISKEMIRCVQNVALFDCIRAINSPPKISDSITYTPKQYLEYNRFAETLWPEYFEIIETLKDFQPTE